MPNGSKDEPTILSKSSSGSSSKDEPTIFSKSSSGSSSSDGGQGSSKTTSVVSSNGDVETTRTITITRSSSSSSSLNGGQIDSKPEKSQKDDDCDCSNCDDADLEDCFYDCEEKTSLLGEINTCRGNNTKISHDLVEIRKELTVVKKNLQGALDDSAQLKTKWIAASADAQKWKTKSESLEINLKKALEDNTQSNKTVNEYSTTINNLRTTINEITIKNNKCGAESDEWKRKWEAENAKVIQSEKTIKELQSSNDDLKTRINKLTDDLTSCQNGNQQNHIEINKFKNTVNDLQKNVSTCSVDLGTCNIALKRVTDDFDVELELGECDNSKKEIEKNLQSERTNVDKCKKEIVSIREVCSTRYQKYEDDITKLKSDSKVSIDQCEASLKLEKDNNADNRIEITKLQNQIVGIESKLNISIKTSEDWQKKSKLCEDDSITAKQTIETQRTNLEDTNKHLSICVANSNSLQTDLTSCKSKLEDCSGNLVKTKTKLADSEVVTVNQNSKIDSLGNENKRCQTEITKLRCDVEGHLAGVRSAEQKVSVALQQALSILDGNTKSSNDFIGSQNIYCKAT